MKISEKFGHTGDGYIIKTVFKITYMLMRTGSARSPQQMTNCIYSIPCECGRNYIEEMGRPFAVQPQEQRHNLWQGLQ
jgi:hypothetical protein